MFILYLIRLVFDNSQEDYNILYCDIYLLHIETQASLSLGLPLFLDCDDLIKYHLHALLF